MPTPRQIPHRPAVALLIETSNAFSRELLHGVRDWMRANSNWAIHLSEQGRGNTPPPWLGSWRGNGIIARLETEEIAQAVRACGVPVVNVSAAGIAPEFPAVTSDSTAIAEAAAEHLAGCGLRHFGYCGDARFEWSTRHGENFAAAILAKNLPCEIFRALKSDASNWTREQERLAQWLRSLPRPVGVMACYDIRGQQVLDVCRAIGLRVPDDVAVIGQHNDELLCELCDPPLSSVVPNARLAGFKAAGLLNELMLGRTPKETSLQLPPAGVAIRQSTDVVAVDDERIARAMRFIRDRACTTMTVDEIARTAGMSRSLFERRFRATFGTSPWDRVLELRFREAERLLHYTDVGLAEIAERTGFVTSEHFSAAFRNRRGMPPSALRRRARGK